VGDHQFGKFHNHLDFFFATLRTLPKLSSVDAQTYMSDVYDTTFNLYNHLTPNPTRPRPLAIVALHPQEHVVEGGAHETAYRLYRDKKIQELWGLSLTEFLLFPASEINTLVRLADEELSKKAREVSEVQDSLKDLDRKK
jgi:hypothetical protein